MAVGQLNPNKLMHPITKVVCITQARTTSTRLPQIVLLEVQGQSLLAKHLTHAKRCATVHSLVLALTVNASNDDFNVNPLI